MSAPRRPGDDRRAGRRAGPRPSRDRRDASPRDARPAGSTPREDDAQSERKPDRTAVKAGKPRTARSEAWAAAKPPRDGERPARPAKPGGRKRGPRDARPSVPATSGQAQAPWSSEAAPTERGAARPHGPRRIERPDVPAARAPRRDGAPGRPVRATGRVPEGRSRPPREEQHVGDRGEALFTRRPRRTDTTGDTAGERRPVSARSPRVEASAPTARRGAPSERRPAAPRAPRGEAPAPSARVTSAPKPRDRARTELPRSAPKAPASRIPASPDTAAGATSRNTPQRIAKLLARAGVASRREIERMIAEGRIALNGVTLDTPATILPSLHGVTVDGHQVDAPEPTRLFLFHKPTGFLTTEHDPAGRPTIYDRLPEGLPRVMPIGRLDMNTEGLLLLTTDGEFKRKLELPSTGVPRVYRARAYGEVTQDQLEALIEGITIEGIRYGPIDANMERRTGRNMWIEMKITEGKNREVRRVLEYLGLQVSRLIRVAYGEFILADLPPGEVVEVRQHDLEEFRKTLR
ncbi:MAG TPA: pseudouridine synthase [Sphingomonas sp.]|nr:pseudouridine synthase [Sphingomonas sp.]